MATAITLAFESWNAQQVLNKLPVRPDTIIFANVPGQDPDKKIDRREGLPDDKFIVHRDFVTQYGLINENAVAYSIVLDTRIGDFEFNWLGLLDSESNTLCMIVHTLPQQKIATGNGIQGNNITRTFLMEYDGAAAASQITVTAETWQIDYSARMAGIDESLRLANLDHYGHAAFFDNGFNVTREGEQFRIAAGVGYVGGLRVVLTDDTLIDAPADASVWVDVSLQGTVTGQWLALTKFVVANEYADYVDEYGFHHYVAKLATEENTIIEDERPPTPQEEMTDAFTDALAEHEKSTNHPKATTTSYGFVMLNNSVTSTSINAAATSKAVKQSYDLADSKVLTVNNKPADDAKNVELSAVDVGALPLTGGTYTGEITATYNGSYGFAYQHETKAAFYNSVTRDKESEYHPLIKQDFHIPGHSWNTYSFGVLNHGNGVQDFKLHIIDHLGAGLAFSWTPVGDYYVPLSVYAGSNLYAHHHLYTGGGQSHFRNDGMVYGPVWGGDLASWVSRNFISDIRWGSAVEIGRPGGGQWYGVPWESVVTGLYNNGNSYISSIRARPLQKYINGGWWTIGAI
ncbi:phage tail protein [Pragia fontium]|uniref:Phage tail fibre repeat-containing protein n=1 Tax=Pragia fontium DSM 5563 = ATCC 49100 TaxID=1122977 RepID=A0AAJ4W9I7_9GAMM|nr:phage tail protein [Pragia fontium]SFC50123.1 Phage tail fibre repeat-containing protein [Pragia fontium DSM 5563 = ATCC 49100]